jgi:hypothetical protein
MGGPGVDPNYTGSTTEASAWGARQAARALSDIADGGGIDYPVVWMDVELPGIAPAPDNGWNSVYTSPCSGVVRQSYVPTAVDRADFNGFAAYIAAHSSYKVGVYSSPGVWASIFGTGTDSLIPDTYEWTYEPETASLSNAPYGWCLRSGGCAQFFGGQTSSSSHALMWQWSGGGGIRNGSRGLRPDRRRQARLAAGGDAGAVGAGAGLPGLAKASGDRRGRLAQPRLGARQLVLSAVLP